MELGKAAPSAMTYALRDGRYALARRFPPGEPLRLTEPFEVDVDLAALAQRTRPPG